MQAAADERQPRVLAAGPHQRQHRVEPGTCSALAVRRPAEVRHHEEAAIAGCLRHGRDRGHVDHVGHSLTGVPGASSSAPCMSLRLTIQDSAAPSSTRRSKRRDQPLTRAAGGARSRRKAGLEVVRVVDDRAPARESRRSAAAAIGPSAITRPRPGASASSATAAISSWDTPRANDGGTPRASARGRRRAPGRSRARARPRAGRRWASLEPAAGLRVAEVAVEEVDGPAAASARDDP